MALPLRVADEVIGVLDVQSVVPKAFEEEDIEVLSTLADQVSIAIQNSRTYETMQDLLTQAQRTSGSFLEDSWRVLQSQDESVGYRLTENKLKSLTKPITSAQIRKAIANRQTVMESGENATLAIPIRLRNEVIGIMNIQVQNAAHDWDPDEVDVAEAVAERLSLALEASLLLKSTQRQAEIERITADISGKLGATTQFDAILRTAAEELSRVLGGSDVLVQVQTDSVQEEL
jgi:GAF domain-containing protein